MNAAPSVGRIESEQNPMIRKAPSADGTSSSEEGEIHEDVVESDCPDSPISEEIENPADENALHLGGTRNLLADREMVSHVSCPLPLEGDKDVHWLASLVSDGGPVVFQPISPPACRPCEAEDMIPLKANHVDYFSEHIRFQQEQQRASRRLLDVAFPGRPKWRARRVQRIVEPVPRPLPDFVDLSEDYPSQDSDLTTNASVECIAPQTVATHGSQSQNDTHAHTATQPHELASPKSVLEIPSDEIAKKSQSEDCAVVESISSSSSILEIQRIELPPEDVKEETDTATAETETGGDDAFTAECPIWVDSDDGNSSSDSSASSEDFAFLPFYSSLVQLPFSTEKVDQLFLDVQPDCHVS